MWLPAAKHRLSIVQLHQTVIQWWGFSACDCSFPHFFSDCHQMYIIEATRVEGQGRDCFRWAWGGGNHWEPFAAPMGLMSEWWVEISCCIWLGFYSVRYYPAILYTSLYEKMYLFCRYGGESLVGPDGWEIARRNRKGPHSCPVLRSMAKNSSETGMGWVNTYHILRLYGDGHHWTSILPAIDPWRFHSRIFLGFDP